MSNPVPGDKSGRAAAIVVGGGSGHRMGAPVRKQYLSLLGKPIIFWTLSRLAQAAEVQEIILVVPQEDVEHVDRRWGGQFRDEFRVSGIIPGGVLRQDSVWEGLNALSPEASIVLVHDAVRPLVSVDTVRRVISAIRTHGAAIAAAPIVATVKETDEAGRIKATHPRENFWKAQTPQGAMRRLLLEAYEKLQREGREVTDDALALERAGHEVYVVEDSRQNIKVTTPEDIVVAEAVLRWQNSEQSGSLPADSLPAEGVTFGQCKNTEA